MDLDALKDAGKDAADSIASHIPPGQNYKSKTLSQQCSCEKEAVEKALRNSSMYVVETSMSLMFIEDARFTLLFKISYDFLIIFDPWDTPHIAWNQFLDALDTPQGALRPPSIRPMCHFTMCF